MRKLEDAQVTPASPKLSGGEPASPRLPSPERRLTVSPLDMRQTHFASALRGFNKVEVTAFLEEASAGYENALRENERLRQQISSLEGALHHYRQLEDSLKSTLLSAQKVADDMRENARQEAARIVRDAEGRAELIVQKGVARVEDVQREIDSLRLKRREVQTNIEACVATLQHTSEFICEQEQRERDNRVIPHRPREVQSA
jgi:cell division initiation protein